MTELSPTARSLCCGSLLLAVMRVVRMATEAAMRNNDNNAARHFGVIVLTSPLHHYRYTY